MSVTFWASKLREEAFAFPNLTQKRQKQDNGLFYGEQAWSG